MMFPLAIVDYGIGGLGLLKLIKRDYPAYPVFYFSDSGELPYGTLSKQVLSRRIGKVTDFILNKYADRVVVACHSASSVLDDSHANIIGIRKPTVDSVLKNNVQSVGIIGGGRTIRSQFYKKALQEKGLIVKQRTAQILSILIERGEVDSILTVKSLEQVVAPLRKLDCLLLACTHYPVLTDLFRETLGSEVLVIDPIEEVYRCLKPSFGAYSSAQDVYVTTGTANTMKEASLKAFGVKIPAISKLDVSLNDPTFN